MYSGFLISLITVGLAELGDKTQLAILILAAKTKKHARLALGVITAFGVVDGLAIWCGAWISTVVPFGAVRVFTGMVFIVFGLLMLMRKGDGRRDPDVEMKTPFFSGFAVIFLSEMGDKTQIAAGLFATKYAPLQVLAGTLTALTLLSFLAIWAGRFIATKVHPARLSSVAAVLFLTIGALTILAR